MTLGDFLKEKRLHLNRSIQQISAETRIHIKILKAIEEDRYADLPAKTFTRGFIISYCKALDLDADQVLSDFHSFLESKFPERKSRDQGHQGYVFESNEQDANRKWVIVGVSIAVVFCVAVLLIFKPQNRHRGEKVAELKATPTASPVANQEPGNPESEPAEISTPTPLATVTPSPAAPTQNTPTVSPSPSESPSALPSATPDPLFKGDDLAASEANKRISFEAIEDTLVEYQVDQKQKFAIRLRAGKFLVIKAKEKIWVKTLEPQKLRYRTRSREFQVLTQGEFGVNSDGSLSSN